MADKKKKNWYDIDEASVVAGIKGVQMPLGAKGKKKKNNPSKPYGEDEIFENKVVAQEMNERIEPTGDGQWVVIDPRSGAKHGPFPSRDAARDAQANLGITVKRDPSKPKGSTSGQKKTAPVKQRRPKKVANLEHIKRFIKRSLRESGLKLVKESSMISYIFEEKPTKPGSSIWETVVGKLPREVVMSDQGLGEILQSVAVAEARTLARSVLEIKKVLERSGPFLVERQEADQDPDTGDIRMPFVVALGENTNLLFAVKLEHGKPLVLFPEESRNALNNMLTNESKLLRAELMHIQETILDGIDDVIQAGLKRDTYLEQMQFRLNGLIEGMNLVETMLLKNLVREKLRGVK